MLFFSKNLKYLRESKGLKQFEMADSIEFNRTTWNGYETGKSYPNFSDLIKISDFFHVTEGELIHADLSTSYLSESAENEKKHKKSYRKPYQSSYLNEDVSMFRDYETPYTSQRREQKLLHEPNRIPLYDDVVSVGGVGAHKSDVQGISQPVEYIDTGDWFKDATAAIRHYGESMKEYPSGCILALKEVDDRNLIIWGKNYVIETSEYRITKRLHQSKKDNCIRAYSTNKETYADGELIHEPIDIPLGLVRRLSLVLGCVIKENGGTMVFNTSKKK